MGVRRQRKARQRGLASVAAICAITLAACGGGQAGAAGGEADSLTHVKVAFNPGTVLQLYAGLSHDIFEKHGLDLELIQFESGAAANAAYASGDVDLGYAGIPGVFAANIASGNTRVFMVDNEGWDAGGLVAGPNSGVESVKDLEGKSVGTVIGTTSWMALMTALEAEGVDASAVDIQNVGPTAWVPALNQGDVDAIWGWAPLIYTMEDGGGQIVATDSEYVLNPLLWQARGPYIDENPDVIAAFIAAYQEAAPYVEERDPSFIDTMEEFTGADRNEVEKTVDAIKLLDVEDYLAVDSPYSFVNDEGLKTILEQWLAVLTENEILQEEPDLDNLIDPSGLQAYVADDNV